MFFPVSSRKGRLGSLKFFAKDVTKHIPGFGWGNQKKLFQKLFFSMKHYFINLKKSKTGMYLLDFVFLKRNWNQDISAINQTFHNLRVNGFPYWIISHLEGTRINPKKLKESQTFAKQKGLPILDNVLVPRTKGFVATVQGLRNNSANAVYDVTIIYLDSKTGDCSHKVKGPSFFSLAFRSPQSSVHMYIRRFEISTLPTSEEELTKWCFKVWEEKNDLIKYFQQHKTFEKPISYPPWKHQSLIL